MAKKRRRASLPRMSLLSLNQNQLVSFIQALETIPYQVELLQDQLDRLHAQVVSLENRTGRIRKGPAPASADVPAPIPASVGGS